MGANWVDVASKIIFIPFILLLLLLCNIVFYGNIVNIRNKGDIEIREGTTVGPEKQNRLKRCGVGKVLRKNRKGWNRMTGWAEY